MRRFEVAALAEATKGRARALMAISTLFETPTSAHSLNQQAFVLRGSFAVKQKQSEPMRSPWDRLLAWAAWWRANKQG